MDDLKLYAMSEIDSLVKVVESYSRYVVMEFGMEKCAVVDDVWAFNKRGSVDSRRWTINNL